MSLQNIDGSMLNKWQTIIYIIYDNDGQLHRRRVYLILSYSIFMPWKHFLPVTSGFPSQRFSSLQV